MTLLNRRQALVTVGCGSAALMLGAAAQTKRTGLGVVTYALGIHQKHGWAFRTESWAARQRRAGRQQGLAPGLAFLEEARRFGAGGIQFPFGPADAPHASEVRRRAESYNMHVEAIINPPATEAEVARFENDVRVARQTGANLARTVLIPGRRYEQFKTLAEFREAEKQALKSLRLAEPVLARHRFRLAVENHKDQLIAEKLDLLERVRSEWIGLCVDVANNFALMEEPLETMRAFAPFAFTVHIKDMVAQEHPEGWLLSDVALGDGFLDLKRIVEVLRAAKPDVKFNLESITRDAIKVPVRTEAFWATLPGPRAPAIEHAAATVKAKPGVPFVDGISKLTVEKQLEAERRVIERSLKYAREHLGL